MSKTYSSKLSLAAIAALCMILAPIGASAMTAEELLPDHQNQRDFGGVEVRKGTVGAFIANARVLADARASAEAKAAAERHIRDALPALKALGVFETFEVRDPSLRALVAKNL